jgi:hypothetical protein
MSRVIVTKKKIDFLFEIKIFQTKELLLMTIIKVTIPITQNKKVVSNQHKNGQTTTHTYTEKIINFKSITTEIKQCVYGCKCSNDESYCSSTCNDDLDHIKKILIDGDMDPNDQIKKISDILDQNLLISLNTIITSCNASNDVDYINEKLLEAKNLVGVTDSSSDNVGLRLIYPYAVSFEQTDDKYEAQIHVNEQKDNDRLFITYETKDDGMSCGCCPSTYYNQIPLELSLSYPTNTNYLFKKHDHYIRFTKSHGDKTYDKYVIESSN